MRFTNIDYKHSFLLNFRHELLTSFISITIGEDTNFVKFFPPWELEMN